MKSVISSLALVAILLVSAKGGELRSGLRPGDLATPFEVKDVTGPNKGITLCYR